MPERFYVDEDEDVYFVRDRDDPTPTAPGGIIMSGHASRADAQLAADRLNARA